MGKRVLVLVLLGLVALAIGFFGSANALFSDASRAEAILTVLASAVVLGIAALVGGRLAPEAWRAAGLTAGLASLPPVLLFGLEQPLLAVVAGLSNLAAALFGAWMGGLWARASRG